MSAVANERIRALLDRLDLRVADPCRLPGCTHVHPVPTAVPRPFTRQQAA